MPTAPWKLAALGLATSAGAIAYSMLDPAGPAQAAAQSAARSCDMARFQTSAPKDTTIVSAKPTASPVAHCRVEGYVTTNDPTPNRVNFRLQLPDSGWSGRYYFIGMGGAAGYVPTDSQIPAGNPLHRGFAVAGTDTGHQGHMLDWSFLSDPAKAADHVHRGAHVVAQATQKLTKDHYGVESLFRYMSGCSGGGRMSTEAIERHPEDFDGVLIGAPGGRSSATMLKFVAAAQEMMKPGAFLPPEKLSMIEAKVTAACDASDGATDEMVWDHRACKFNVDALQCTAGDGPNCLTKAQLTTFKAILNGPRGPNGKKLAEGMPITNTSTWSGFIGRVPPPWSSAPTMENLQKSPAGYVIASTVSHAFFGPNYDPARDFSFKNQKDIDAWWAAAKRTGFGLPYTAELGGFQKAGGKVIFWNGVSDSCCSDVELEQYYADASRQVQGGLTGLRRFAKYYPIPGMAHCGGGTGPHDAVDKLLDELINWVEKRQAPGGVVAHRGAERVQLAFADPKTKQVSGVLVPPPSGSPRDFLLCPAPLVSTFNPGAAKRPGAAYEAANWSCQPAKPNNVKRTGSTAMIWR